MRKGSGDVRGKQRSTVYLLETQVPQHKASEKLSKITYRFYTPYTKINKYITVPEPLCFLVYHNLKQNKVCVDCHVVHKAMSQVSLAFRLKATILSP